MKNKYHNLIYLLPLFIILIVFANNSCKKLDFAAQLNQTQNLSELFFTPKGPISEETAGIIKLLKNENEKTGFVNKLPARCGLPVWEKSICLNVKNIVSQFTSGTDTAYIIPLTENNQSLSSIIIVTGNMQSGYTINCYTQSYLYQLTHGENVNTTDAEKALHIFFLMENITFGTTSFYHIPPNLFINSTKLDSNGNKTIKLDTTSSGAPNSSSYVICVYHYHCIETSPCNPATGYCDYCTGCLTTSCISINDDPCPLCLPPPPPPGGNGGGGGNSPQCNYSFTGSWYAENVVNPNPCNPQPPLPPNPCQLANLLAANPNFRALMQSLKDSTVDNKEHGILYDMGPNGNMSIEIHKGLPDSGDIDLPVTTLNDGYLHSHYTGLLSVFTPMDLLSFCQMYSNGWMQSPSTFTAGVVTANGTQYLLKIENLTLFQTFSQNLTGTTINKYKEFYKIMYNIKDTNTNEDNEKNLLKYLDQLKSGLKLFRGNANFTQWTPLGLDANNNVIVKPCNS